MTTQYVRHNVSLEKSDTIHRYYNTEIQKVLVVDIETTLDIAQTLRLAGYTLYSFTDNCVLETGLITGLLSNEELQTLQHYAGTHNLHVMSRNDFITSMLYPQLENGSALVNHNIRFDLGGLATSWFTDNERFYLKLCACTGTSCKQHPNIAIRDLGFRKAMMYVDNENKVYGAILDTLTIGMALLGPGSASLKDMGLRFKCNTVKQISDEHGEQLNDDYLDYTMRDVQATLELFLAEMTEYKRHGLLAPITSIMSEASIGKAYFQQLGVPPFYQQHTELPAWLNSVAMKTMYGARSEVKIRLEPTEIRYCDFKSQYPTVNALLGLQELLLATSITVKHKTAEVQAFLNTVEVDDLQKPGLWKRLRAMVKFAPDNDIVPNKFDTIDEIGSKVTGYAVCYTKAPENWYTLCDAIASKLLTGKAPTLIDAIVLYPSGHIQTTGINLFGDDTYTIDLSKDDLFTRVIDLRTQVKKELKAAKSAHDIDQVGYLDSLQLALKLLANSTSYGVLVETRYEKGIETAGKYYAAPVGVHITGAARLLLAIAECLGRDRGLTYAMCDTDSMAYAKPENMSRENFHTLVDDITQWFNPLSPYTDKAALFELEEVNEYQEKDTPLYFLGVSCKRYCLYNKLPDGTYRLRKISAHATGRYQFDRDLPLPSDVPAPTIYCKLWQYLLWYRAVQQAEQHIQIVVPDEEWSSQVVRYQESMSTPGKLKQHGYLPGIRPYSFITETPTTPGCRHRYVMPFMPTNASIMTATPFVAGTTRIDTNPTYDTLQRRFSGFFCHSETKAENGTHTGLLQRRSLDVEQLQGRTRTGRKIDYNDTTLDQATLWNDLA